MLCKGVKICKKKMSYFGINISKNLLVSSNYKRLEDRKTENRPEAPWDRIASFI